MAPSRPPVEAPFGQGPPSARHCAGGPRRLTALARTEAPACLDYEPNIFIYDNYPGGIGLSEPLYRLHDRLLAEARSLIAGCACQDGCPSCVGPAGEVGSRGKDAALALLTTMTPS